MALIFDLIGSCISWYNLPYASVIITMAIVVIEGRSVWENEKAKKSNIAKLPDVIRAIIQCSDVRSAEELIKKFMKQENETEIDKEV